MIKAALTEIRSTPIATLGALAGIASFVFIILEPAPTSALIPANPSASAIALAFTKAALIVPAVAFFFAFVSHLFFLGGFMRGVLASALFLLVSVTLGSIACGLILSPFRPFAYPDSVVVLGVPSEAFAFASVLLNLLVNAVVLSETVYAYYQERADDEGDHGAMIIPVTLGALFGAMALTLVSTSILNMVLVPS